MVMLNATASSSGMDLALTNASNWVERHITNSAAGSIRRSVIRETVAGSGSQQLMLSRTPIRKVSRIFSATSTADATEYCSTSFRIEDPDAGFVTMTDDAGFAWDAVWEHSIERYPRPAQVARHWMVLYEAGWIRNETSSTCSAWVSTSTGRTLPEDVEHAVLLKAAEFYQAGGGSGDIVSMRVGPLSLNYGSEAVDPVVSLLAPYRRVT